MSATPSDVPDILAPGLRAVFTGINPGRVSAAANAHFANPRNDFWRLLHESGLTPRLLEPAEQETMLTLGYGLTNAAYRTTPGSSDLRRADFRGSRERLESLARDLHPLVLAFVGKEAYRGAFGGRPQHGLQGRLVDTLLYVLPSTSPANAAVPYAERLRWFKGLADLLEPVERHAVRAVVLDRDDRILLVRYRTPGGREFWTTPGGGLDEGEDDEAGLRRELAEELGLRDFEIGPCVWAGDHVFVGDRHPVVRQLNRDYLVRIDTHDPVPEVDLPAEGVHAHRWWTLEELVSTSEDVGRLSELLGPLLADGPPDQPLDGSRPDTGVTNSPAKGHQRSSHPA
jgi:TDG/mug DNA glycosylase family protein